MSLLEFVVDKTGVYGILMTALTAAYAGLFVNAAWELAALLIVPKESFPARRAGRSIIRFYTAFHDVVKLAALAGFFFTLVGFQQVIEGFRTLDRDLSMKGMGLAVMSSAAYVPIVALGALWLLLCRLACTVRPEVRDFLWSESRAAEPQERPA